MFQGLEIMVTGSTAEFGEGLTQCVGPLLNDPKSLDNIFKLYSDGGLLHSKVLNVVDKSILVSPKDGKPNEQCDYSTPQGQRA